MGIFGSKTRYHYRVSSTNLIDEESKQDYIKNAILSGTLGNQGVVNAYMDQALWGINQGCGRYYKKASGAELIGLPTGTLGGGDIDMIAVKAALDQREGQSCTVQEAQFTTVAPEMIAMDYLDEHFGIDLQTLKLETAPNHLANDAIVYYKSAAWGNNAVNGNIQVIITYEHRDSGGIPIAEYSITYENESIDKEALYLYTAYTIDSESSGDVHIWVYNSETELYPAINYKDLYSSSPYYPIIPLRKDKENITDTASAPQLLDVKRALKPIGFDLDLLIDQIMGSEGAEPDKMEEVFFLFAMDLREHGKYGQQYLRKYFKDLQAKARTNESGFNSWLSGGKQGVAPLNIIEIFDDNFQNTYSYNYIKTEITNGQLGNFKPGEGYTYCLKGNEIKRQNTSFIQEIIENTTGNDFDLLSHSDEYFIVTQISETQFETITVSGLTCYHRMTGDANNTYVVEKRVWDGFDPEAEDGADNFFMPVSKPIIESFIRMHRNYIYQESMNVTVYAIVVQKVKWYERGWVAWLVRIIVFIIAFFTQQWYLLTAWQIVQQIVIQLIIQFAVQKAIEALIDILGLDKFAILAAIVYIVALAYGVDLTEMLADSWIEMANLAMNAYQLIYMDDLQYEMKQWEDFTKSAEEVREEIEEAEEFLKSDSIDYYTILKNQLYFDPNETPDEFYVRTIHDRNPGTKAFDIIHSWVDIKLQLPRNNDFTPKTL